jgi:ATP-dependent Clp protease ATP-binding subunit ClpC
LARAVLNGQADIAEGIAHLIANSETCPPPLQGRRMISIELALLVAGTKYRGEFEERLQTLIVEATDPNAPATIMLLDEMHTLVGAGSASGNLDSANILKPALARGALQVMGVTIIAEYRKYIEKDAALERRFQPTLVKEPNVVQTREIMSSTASTRLWCFLHCHYQT